MTGVLRSVYGFNTTMDRAGMLNGTLSLLSMFPDGMVKEMTDGYRARGITSTIHEEYINPWVTGRASITSSRLTITLADLEALIHEVGHAIDWYLGMLAGRRWISSALPNFNNGHRYGGEYHPDVFSTPYGSTSSAEDFAEIVDQLIYSPDYVRTFIRSKPNAPLTQKYHFVMDRMVEGFRVLRSKESAFPRIFMAPPIVFADVQTGSVAINAINWASSSGIVTGRNDMFFPQDNMTREQYALVLWRYLSRPSSGAGRGFVDVSSSDVAFEAIKWASESGIVTGRGDRFLPRDNMTRAEMILMMYRVSRLYGKNLSFDPSALNSFGDRGQVPAAAREAMLWGVTHGLITGRGNNLLPNDPVTREQVVLILYRYVHGIGR